MDLKDAYDSLLTGIADSYCELVKHELLKHSEISDVRIVILNRSPFKAELFFLFNEAKISLFFDKSCFVRRVSVGNLPLNDAYMTVESLVNDLTSVYKGYLKKMAQALTEALAPTHLNRKQQVLYKQSQLVEAGFSVDITVNDSGGFYFSISHPKLDGPLKKLRVTWVETA